MSRENTDVGKIKEPIQKTVDQMNKINIFFTTLFHKIILFFTTYAMTLLENFTSIHTGSMEIKFKAITKIGVLLSPILLLLEQIKGQLTEWSIGNSKYIQLVLLAIVVDHVLGTIKHLFFTKDFKFGKNLKGIVTKVGLTIACGFLFEGLNHLITEQSIVKNYMVITTRAIVFLYPAGSAFSSSSIISGGKFPPIGWMDKLKRFQSNLDTDDFKKPNK